jgi:hypothetical protein
MIKTIKTNKHYIYGGLASLMMLILYVGIMLIFNPLYYVIDDFISKFIWFSLLIIIFGVQIGLITFVRSVNNRRKMTNGQTALSGGISTTSMLACCIHHVTEFIPLIGISAFTIFLVEFQVFFLIVGILFGTLSIMNILIHIQKHKVFESPSIFEYLKDVNLLKFRKVYVWLFIITVLGYGFYLVNGIFVLGGEF